MVIASNYCITPLCLQFVRIFGYNHLILVSGIRVIPVFNVESDILTNKSFRPEKTQFYIELGEKPNIEIITFYHLMYKKKDSNTVFCYQNCSDLL